MDEIVLTRDYEEKHIVETLETVNRTVSEISAEVAQMKKDIDNMWDQYFAGDVEIWVSLHNTIAMYETQTRSLSKYERAARKPYFGRIVFTDESLGTRESLYIGRCGINRDLTTQLVADWRAPISNVYYENGLGECSFLSPDGDDINLNLELKRTFDIEGGRLLGYVDSEVVANDDLLTKYLSKNKQAVLGEIVATIQKEQNDIIRRSAFKNVIVQGAAGSGKTTVAMHRISYILYNYAERITPDRFYIIGSNRMLLNYITGVLPELDVDGVRQMTMEEMFVHILGDLWDEEKHHIATGPAGMNGQTSGTAQKGTTARFEKLEEYCRQVENRDIRAEDVVLNRDCFTEGVTDGKTGVFDRSEQKGTADYLKRVKGIQKYQDYASCTRLLPTDYVRRLISENPEVSVQRKIDILNDKLTDNLEFEFTSHASRYTAKEHDAIVKYFKGWFGKPEYNGDLFGMYEEFLRETGDTQTLADIAKGKGYDVYDLACLAYIYKRVFEKNPLLVDYHIVIDEAQDYGMTAFRALKFCFANCTYTIMGDVSQNIRYDSGINNWDELRGLLLTKDGDAFCTLRKSYRNTVEISEFATQILDHGDFEVYPVEPIIRHGDEPCILKVEADEAVNTIVEMCRTWQQEERNTIAIVCRDFEESERVSGLLKKAGLELLDSSLETAEFGNGVMVLPVYLTKGLEFDAVLIYEPTREAYPVDDRHAKLLYVAATRALHELCVVCSGELTGLIADKVPADKIRHVVDADPVTETETMTPGEKAKLERKRKMADDEYVKSKLLSNATDRMVKSELGKVSEGYSVETVGAGYKGMSPEKIAEIKTEKTTEKAAENTPEKTPEEVTGLSGDAGKIFAAKAPEDFITPAGHASPALITRWVTKQNNGIYVQSAYGILRICPIAAGVIRLTFVRGSSFKAEDSPKLKPFSMLKNFKWRDTGKIVEVSTDRITLNIDRQTGAIIYKDGKGRELLREKNQEPRVIVGNGDRAVSFINLMPNKNRTYHAYERASGNMKYIGDAALMITPDDGTFPLVLVKDMLGIMVASNQRTAFNNLAGYGTSLVTGGEVLDYFFMVGTTEELISYYNKLML